MNLLESIYYKGIKIETWVWTQPATGPAQICCEADGKVNLNEKAKKILKENADQEIYFSGGRIYNPTENSYFLYKRVIDNYIPKHDDKNQATKERLIMKLKSFVDEAEQYLEN